MTAEVRTIAKLTLNPAERAAQHMAQARDEARIAALQVLSYLTEAAERAKEAGSLGALIPPSVADGLPRLADHINREIERMALAMKNGGTIR